MRLLPTMQHELKLRGISEQLKSSETNLSSNYQGAVGGRSCREELYKENR